MTPDASPLRLAIFSDTALPQMNGVSRTLDRLATAVRARGGAVRTFTTTDPDAATDAPDVVRFPSRPFWAYPQLRLALPSTAAAAGALREWGATLVHAATPFGVGLAGRSAAAELGLPFVSSYHTSLSAYARFYRLGALSEPGWAFLRWFHNGGRRTYCPTRAIERELHAHGFTRTHIWTRGVDPVRFAPSWRSAELRARWTGSHAPSDDRLVVVYVGRLAAEKGLDLLLDGYRRAQAAAPDRFVFVFAGDGPYAAHCREHAPRGSHFLGQVVGDELSRTYASADLFVFPSTTDTFGNVLLEAMASGLAVLGADTASTREVLGTHGGATFAAHDPDALARCLLELAHDPSRRAAMRASAVESARARSWDRIFDDLVADYRAVIDEHRATPPGAEPRRRTRRNAFARSHGTRAR